MPTVQLPGIEDPAIIIRAAVHQTPDGCWVREVWRRHPGVRGGWIRLDRCEKAMPRLLAYQASTGAVLRDERDGPPAVTADCNYPEPFPGCALERARAMREGH